MRTSHLNTPKEKHQLAYEYIYMYVGNVGLMAGVGLGSSSKALA